MTEQKKIFRVLQLIARLRSPLGCTKADVAQSFEVSERTVERYFDLLRDIGFDVTKSHNRFRIESTSKGCINPEELIVFSLEEAALIKQAIEAAPIQSPLQKNILSKLYALTDMDNLAESIYNQNISRNISIARRAIASKQQLILKSYQSISSSTVGDRLVEPISFHSYFQYLMAYEVASGEVKQFKVERIGEAIQTDKPFRFEDRHRQKSIDTFGMSGSQAIEVTLRLSNRAKHLLVEEHPEAATSIEKQHGAFIYKTQVYSFEGIGRFVLGLLGEVEVVEPIGLKEYIEEKVKYL